MDDFPYKVIDYEFANEDNCSSTIVLKRSHERI
jgi:hypothetical protein